MADTPPKGFNYIYNTCKSIYQKEGAKAFVRGLGPTCELFLLTLSLQDLYTDSFYFRSQMSERE